jgi:acetyl esterase
MQPKLQVSEDYRLAPEHKSPSGAEDDYAAVKWVADNGPPIMVDSAGYCCSRIDGQR